MSGSLLVGVVLAIASLAYVLYPLVSPRKRRPPLAVVGARAPRTVTDEEIEGAIRSYRETHAVGGVACPACGQRPEPDAAFCSTCGRRLDHTARAP
jgi:hypothetical protein